MIEFFSHFSVGTTVIMMVFLFAIPSVSALWIVRRYFGFLIFKEQTEFGGIFSNAIAVAYAMILAFVAVAIWQNYNTVDDTVSAEANTLHNVYRNLDGYPEPIRSESKGQIRTYVRKVVKEEWSKLAKGEENQEANHLITRISEHLLTFNPRNNKELVLHQEVIKELSAYRTLRHTRIRGAVPNIGGAMWITLIGGTFVFILYLCFFDMPSLFHHVFMVGALATLIGLVFFLLAVYNYPFTEPGAISPDAFTSLLSEWKADH